MTLAELAIACYCFQQVDKSDVHFTRLRERTNGDIDLSRVDHRLAVILFLSGCGCRQFAVADHELAAEELGAWYGEWSGSLPPVGVRLMSLDDPALDAVGAAYDALCNRTASRKSPLRRVTFGPTGASKTLFAVRPDALAPWDEAIRVHMQHRGVREYAGFLRQVRDIARGLQDACRAAGFELTELPERVGRTGMSALKLIDEYFWVKLTRKFEIPSRETMSRWLEWS